MYFISLCYSLTAMFYNNASNNASSNINLKYQAFIKRIKK